MSVKYQRLCCKKMEMHPAETKKEVNVFRTSKKTLKIAAVKGEPRPYKFAPAISFVSFQGNCFYHHFQSLFFTAKRFPIVRHELRILISVRKQNIFCLGVFEAVKRGSFAVRRAAEQFLQSARLPPILLHSSSSGYHENNTDKATHSLRALSEFAPLLHDELIESAFFHSVFHCWAVF